MRNQEHIDHAELLATWQADLRGSLVSGLDPDRVESLAAGIAAMAGSSALATASVVATQGGTRMLETTTATTAATNAAAGVTAGAAGATAGAAATGSLGTKIAAGALAASLVGGAAAATGTLPGAMQTFVADAAAHIGLDLPRPEVGLDVVGDLNAGLGIGEVIDLGAAGSLSATVDTTAGLVLTGIDEAVGFTASVISETTDSVMVRFESATESATVLLTQVDGEIVASVTTEASADAATSQGTDDGADAVTEAGAEAGTSGSLESDDASVEAESNTSIQIGIGN